MAAMGPANGNLSWRAFWITLGASTTLAAGAVPAVLELPGVAVIVAIVLAGLLVVLGAGSLIRRGVGNLRGMKLAHRSHVASMVTLAVVLHAGWSVAFQVMPHYWIALCLVLIALAGAEYGVACGYEWWRTSLPEKPLKPVDRTEQAEPTDDVALRFREALRLGEYDSLKLNGWEPLIDSAAHPFGVDFDVSIPPKALQKGK